MKFNAIPIAMPKLWPSLKQLLLIMKLSTFLLLISLLQVSAKGFSQISINEKHASLEKILLQIEKQSKYSFIYDEDKLNVSDIDVSVKNVPIEQALDACFKGLAVNYTIVDNNIILKPRQPSFFEKIKDYLAVPITVNGIVTDSAGVSLPGATIFVTTKGKPFPGKANRPAVVYNAATRSREDGSFAINALEGDTINFTFVGYETYKLPVKKEMPAQTIVLRRASNKLTEVTVSTGYQTLSKERATGAFGKPDMQTFSQRAGTNDLVARLDGLVPGLTVLGPGNSTSSKYGNGVSTRQSVIRGKSSIILSPSDPLYVVNGVIVSDFNTVNPDDIEDITVLKDAAASAIWGAKSANGVIVVVTKKGSLNKKIKINYSAYFNYQGKPDFAYADQFLLSSSQYIQAAKDVFNPTIYPYSTLSASFIAPHDQILYNQSLGLISASKANAQLDSLAGINNVSQIKNLFYRNAFTTNHTISASGGGDVYSFYSSLGYVDNYSNQPGSSNDTYRINLNQTYNPVKAVKLSLFTSINNTVTSAARAASVGATFLPYQLFQDDNGNNINLNYVQGLSAATRADYQARSRINLDYSPLDDINTGYTKGNNVAVNLTANANVKLWKGLSYDGTYTYQRSPGTSNSYDDISNYAMRSELLSFTVAPNTTTAPVYYLPNTGGKYITISNDQRNWDLRNQLIYNMDLRQNKDHLSIQVGQEAQEQHGLSNTSTVRGYNPDLQTYTLLNYATLSAGVLGTVSTGRSTFSEQPYMSSDLLAHSTSYFGLLNYNFNRKYSFDASWRVDHSNQFGSDNSTQRKPSYSFGGKWQIAKEDFMKKITWINDLGLRATYGITGNPYYKRCGYNGHHFHPQHGTGSV